MNREDELVALWLKESKAGKKYMSGRLKLEDGGQLDVVIFKNEYKEAGDNKPDYRVYRSRPREDRQKLQRQSGWKGSPGPGTFSDLDDEIPF